MHVDRCYKAFLFSLLESYACVDICYKEVQLSPTEYYTCLVRVIRESYSRRRNNMHFVTCDKEFLIFPSPIPSQVGGGWPLLARSGSVAWYGVLVLELKWLCI